jgi:hypothetical protein
MRISVNQAAARAKIPAARKLARPRTASPTKKALASAHQTCRAAQTFPSSFFSPPPPSWRKQALEAILTLHIVLLAWASSFSSFLRARLLPRSPLLLGARAGGHYLRTLFKSLLISGRKNFKLLMKGSGLWRAKGSQAERERGRSAFSAETSHSGLGKNSYRESGAKLSGRIESKMRLKSTYLEVNFSAYSILGL